MLRRELLADPVLSDRVRRKYAIRNTHGFRLRALLDGETPIEIFRRLLVGSEGTLAFIAEAVRETIPAPRVTSVAWIPVPTIDEAIALVPGLVSLGTSAVELMIAPALNAASQAFTEAPLLDNPRSQSRCPARRDRREATQQQVLELVSAARLIKPVERLLAQLESLRFATIVVQSPFTTLTRLFHQKCDLLKARVVICTYNHHVRLFSPEPVVVKQPKFTRVEEPTSLCNH